MSEVENAAPSEVPAGIGAPESDATLEDSSPSLQEETPAEPKPKGVQKRLDELTRLRYDAERDRDHWRELALANSKQQQPQPQAPEPQGKPVVSNFSSYEEFSEALAEWKVGELLSRREQEAQAQREQQAAQTLRESFDRRAAAFQEQAPDWRSVVTSMPLNDATFQAAQESEMGPELLYHLGKNPQLAQEFFNLSSRQAALRLGRLEAELSAPKPKRIPGAPPPINPIGGADSASYDPNSGTAEDFRKWRTQKK